MADGGTSRVDEFEKLVESKGTNAAKDPEVRSAAKELLRDAKTDRSVAIGINKTDSSMARQALIDARDQQLSADPNTAAKTTFATAAREAVEQIRDPARRQQAAGLVKELSNDLGVRQTPNKARSGETSRDRSRDMELSL